MGNDIDLVDCDGEGLIYDSDWISPSYSRGYRKLRLTDNVGVYYRIEGYFMRFDVALSFDYLGARAPKSLPILYYGFMNMLDVWEKLGADEEEENEQYKC